MATGTAEVSPRGALVVGGAVTGAEVGAVVLLVVLWTGGWKVGG